MSSKVKWGGIAGLVAAALLIISAILNQMSPDYHRQLPLPRRRARCLHRNNRCPAGHSRVAQRDASVRPIGDHRNGADHRWLRDYRGCDSDQHGAGTTITPHRSPCRRWPGACRLRTSRGDHYPCPVAALVVRRTAHRGLSPGGPGERDLQVRRESIVGLALGICGHCAAVPTPGGRRARPDAARWHRLTFWHRLTLEG